MAMKSNKSILAVAMVAVMCICACTVMASDDTDAAISDLGRFNNTATSSDKSNNSSTSAGYSYADVDLNALYESGKMLYVLIGAEVWLNGGAEDWGPNGAPEDFGFTLYPGEVSSAHGFMTKAGSFTIEFITYSSETRNVTITVLNAQVQGNVFTGGTPTQYPDDPYTGVDAPLDLYDRPIFVESGATVEFALGSTAGVTLKASSVTSGFGLTKASDGTISGTFTKDGVAVINMNWKEGTTTVYHHFQVVAGPIIEVTGVNSVSDKTMGIDSSPLDVSVYTNDYSNSSATVKTLRSEVISGTNVVSTRDVDAASDKMTHVYITPLSIGTATIRVTAEDGSGHYTDFDVTVAQTEYGTLTYYANGGSGAPAQDSDSTYDGEFFYWISETIPTRSGYTFLGWAESSTATASVYAYDTSGGLEDRYYTTNADAKLYAVWEQNLTTYHAKLIYNAGSGSGTPAEQSASITAASPSGSKTFTVSSTVPTRSGYEFMGWSTTNGSSTAQYDAGDSISVAYGNTVTLYAVWKQATITISGTPDAYGIVGSAWKYTPVLSTTGCTLSVSGASWLVSSNGTISGTPTVAGEYTITITASKSGYTSGIQTFTVTVLSNLSFESSPTGGAIIYAV